MKPSVMLTILIVVPILVVWLYGTLVLAEKRSGYVIILLGSLLGLLVPIIHMKGAGVSDAIAKSSGAFFFIWTLSRSALPRSSPSSSRCADCGSICHAPPGSANRVPR